MNSRQIDEACPVTVYVPERSALSEAGHTVAVVLGLVLIVWTLFFCLTT